MQSSNNLGAEGAGQLAPALAGMTGLQNLYLVRMEGRGLSVCVDLGRRTAAACGEGGQGALFRVEFECGRRNGGAECAWCAMMKSVGWRG